MDGGALLQRIPWTKGVTYQNIFSTYCNYVKKKYGRAIVVFDEYQNVSTKDMTHLRRAKKMGMTVEFTSDMPITMVKAEFLSNKINKQRFVNLLGKELEKSHCEVYHADGDADLLIVLKAIESAKTQETVLIGDDTDLLILLCYHTTFDLHPLKLEISHNKHNF